MALCDAEGHIEETFHAQRLPQELPIALLYRAIDITSGAARKPPMSSP